MQANYKAKLKRLIADKEKLESVDGCDSLILDFVLFIKNW